MVVIRKSAYILCVGYLQNGSAYKVGASYSGLYEEGEVEHINVFSIAS